MNRRGFLRALVGGVAALAIAPAAVPAVAAAAKTLHLPTPHLLHPRFIGRSYVLEDTTLHIPRESYQLEFFVYETRG